VRLPDPPLLLVTDRAQTRYPLLDVVAASCAAGCRWISLREKNLPAANQIELARALRQVTGRHAARLTLHGSPATAHNAGADGVHLAAGGDVVAARKLLGADALIGLSVHAAGEVADLNAGIVDYVIAGPVYPTASKPGYGPVLGANELAQIVRATPVPVIAIGGVTPENIMPLVMVGAAGIAVMGSVMRAENPGQAVTALLAALAAARASASPIGGDALVRHPHA